MTELFKTLDNGRRCELYSPTSLPLASSFLWNHKMMVHANCRGYVNAQFMQPEPAKYSHGPSLEAKTFMQPEQGFYAHHPGRFVYVKDLETSEIFSAPYEPVRAELDDYVFIADQSRVSWQAQKNNILVEMTLQITTNDVAELWTLKVTNLDSKVRNLAIYPYFTIGYMSWMNQSAYYDEKSQAIICRGITPYQKYPDYFKNKELKDYTVLLADQKPSAWECVQQNFEGEGGLHCPSALKKEYLDKNESVYEPPVAVLQYTKVLESKSSVSKRFVFAPAKDLSEIELLRKTFLTDSDKRFSESLQNYEQYIEKSKEYLLLDTPNRALNHFANAWLPRQVFYHGDVNRLSTDPQTRNYLQDALGMAYLEPEKTRMALLTALSQQHQSGEMPDGILLHEEAELKYINQVPHADHCVWLPLCMEVYLSETNDLAILDESVGFADSNEHESVYEHMCRAMNWLIQSRDTRGLSYIQQGDWCDPMNMVGYKGKGVSAWLTLATAYALNVSQSLCDLKNDSERKEYFRESANNCNQAVNDTLWKRHWYARGITDDGRTFGVEENDEGKIFLNPQSWAMLSGAANLDKIHSMLSSIDEHLDSDYGVAMLAPAFTEMVEDIGRVTQKFPGSAENGSIYNHAAAFYAYALYVKAVQYRDDGKFSQELADRAYDVLIKMLPSDLPEDVIQRGQLPIFIPNYYRGAVKQFPKTAGRSSQLFNTGTVHWYLRCLVEGLFGLKGEGDSLLVIPNLPSVWSEAKTERRFRGALFQVSYSRSKSVESVKSMEVFVNDERMSDHKISNIQSGKNYFVNVVLPCCQ